MKIKTWHLFVIVIILFIVSFYVVNSRFDKFYRINGINNDERIVLETYLTEEEQTYLIDNQLSLDLFYDYIKDNEFSLYNYKYYNLLKDTKRYKSNKDIVKIGNAISDKANNEFKEKGYEHSKKIISLSLEHAYLNKDNFNEAYIQSYKSIKNLYESDDYTYIDHINKYIHILNQYNITELDDCHTIIELLSNAYTKESLYDYFHYQYNDSLKMIFNPYDLTTVVNNNHYIGEFQPENLILIQDVPRIRYSMYLQSDAYYALLNMYNDLKQYYNGFLLKESYISYDSQMTNQGFNEEQLGLTIHVTKAETLYDTFHETDISQWLEANAYKYGFILRYPLNKQTYTSKEYDSHIYRYVGVDIAKDIYDHQYSLEEYIANQSK